MDQTPHPDLKIEQAPQTLREIVLSRMRAAISPALSSSRPPVRPVPSLCSMTVASAATPGRGETHLSVVPASVFVAVAAVLAWRGRPGQRFAAYQLAGSVTVLIMVLGFAGWESYTRVAFNLTRSLRELKPSSIFDIMAMIALYRPGPMQFIPDYIARKHNPR